MHKKCSGTLDIQLRHLADVSIMKLTWLIFCLGSISLTISLTDEKQLIPKEHKITVALSERKPFVIFDGNKSPRGLDVTIIENFAQKFKLQIDYYICNSSLNNVFANEENFESFSEKTDLTYAFQ